MNAIEKGIADLVEQKIEIEHLIQEQKIELKKFTGPRFSIGQKINFPYFRWFRSGTIVDFVWCPEKTEWYYQGEYVESPKHPDTILHSWIQESIASVQFQQIDKVKDPANKHKKSRSTISKALPTNDEMSEDLGIFDSLDALLADVAKTGKVAKSHGVAKD